MSATKSCKYCGKELSKGNRCTACKNKGKLTPMFVEARDNLRELCGLERMGRIEREDDYE